MSRCVCNGSCMEELNYGDEEDITVVIYKTVDDFKGYDIEVENAALKSNLQTQHTDKRSGCFRLTSVCVLLLCAFLLTAVTVLWIKYNNLTKESELQLQQTISECDSVLKALGWRLFSSSAYHITTLRTTWNETRKECMKRGADLVIINSREEQEFISKYAAGFPVWIGLTDIETEGEFKWVDGSPLTTEFWTYQEPNDLRGEDCAIANFVGARSDIVNWADYPCSFLVVGICEIKSVIGTEKIS
ncbi:C-type lectin domain family 4 member E-like [Hemibagrus wyckioides]|uniref:C-type lectin domain family 4 member E-like n=1 Tax=Hemibagrus wyckioides TaxID=337641 RepID=UPI00266BF8F4|nr:C-type lectin domain family 4 member E-like [Hemibagrus wyckioides]